MSLRNQIAMLLAVLTTSLVVVTYGVQALVTMPAFAKLERQAADRNVRRCIDAIERDMESLSNVANDWGAWDDTYKYVEDRNTAFAEGNLIDEAFPSAHVNFICILDRQRGLVWSEARDVQTLALIEVPDLVVSLQQDGSPFTRFRNVDDAKSGIVLTRHGPILLASRPIITSKREGPIRGTVIMGLFLNGTEITDLADRTHVELDLWTVGQGDIPLEAQRSLDMLVREPGTLFQPVDAQMLHAYTVLNDVVGQPALLLRVRMPRDVTMQGRRAARVAMGCSLLGGLLTLIMIWLVLQWRIVGPLQHMAAHAVQVGRHDDLKARLQLTRTDEIGTLAGEFDRMVERLAATRKKVLDSAHRAGMAEIASDVLHNVGNAVTSANCSVELLDERLQASKVAGLERATSLLREQAPRAAEFFGRDPRGPKLIDYLLDLNDTLQQERTDNQLDVDRLRDTIRHIRDVIASQQEYAERSDFRQEVSLSTVVDDVLQLNREGLQAAQIRVVVHLPTLPDLQLNKSKTTQVLANLVRNAIQAMHGQPPETRQLTISARLLEDTAIEVEVRDTGGGFGPDVQAKLFTHGFTTKPEGHGFGLHYCANAIKETGGHITAHSPGPGLGATFRIRIPHVMTAVMTAT